MSGLPVEREAARHVEQPAAHARDRADLAELALAAHAEEALAALRDPRDHDVVAHLQVVDAFTELGDRARALVAEDRGQADGQGAVHDREVGVADARGAELDADLAGLRPVEIDVEDLERRTDRLCDCGLGHDVFPLCTTVRDAATVRGERRSARVGLSPRARAPQPPRSSRSAARTPYPRTIGTGSTTHITTRPTTITRTTAGENPATTPTAKPTIATSSAR